jgi:hypothetical protein
MSKIILKYNTTPGKITIRSAENKTARTAFEMGRAMITSLIDQGKTFSFAHLTK